MIDFPNPSIGQTVTVGRKTWKCIALDGAGNGIWDLTSTPDAAAQQILSQIGSADASATAAAASASAAATSASGAAASLAAAQALVGAATTTQLVAWALVQAFSIVAATRNANDAITSASILWPDGTGGTYTADTLSATFLGATDAWHATYNGTPAKTITQPAVTRNANGAVTAQPAITIA